MIKLIIGAVIGAVAFGLFLKNNPKWALKLTIVSDRIIDLIDVKNADKEDSK